MAQVIEIPEKDITQKTSKVDDKEVILKLGDYETDKKILELLNKHLEEANDGRSKTKILWHKISWINLAQKFHLPETKILQHLKEHMKKQETKDLFYYIEDMYKQSFLLSNQTNAVMKEYAEHNVKLWEKDNSTIGDVFIQTLTIPELEALIEKNLDETEERVKNDPDFADELKELE